MNNELVIISGRPYIGANIFHLLTALCGIDLPKTSPFTFRVNKNLEVEKTGDLFLLAPTSGGIPNQTFQRQIFLDVLNIFTEHASLHTNKDLEIQTVEENLLLVLLDFHLQIALYLLNNFTGDTNLLAGMDLDVEKIENFFHFSPPSGGIPKQTPHCQIALDLLHNFAKDTNLLADKDLEI